MVNHPNRRKGGYAGGWTAGVTEERQRVMALAKLPLTRGRLLYAINQGEDALEFGDMAEGDLYSDLIALCRAIESHCRVETQETKGNPTAHAAEGKALRARMQVLLAKFEDEAPTPLNADLIETLREYGHHQIWCLNPDDPECQCGWNQARLTLCRG
jgi:hypothetical protein